MGGRPFPMLGQYGFLRFEEDLGLIDIGFIGYPFMWNNNRASQANVQIRLDKGTDDSTWRLLFPKATIFHLTALGSDHRPILLETILSLSSHPKPFRFEYMWSREPSFVDVIHKAGSISVNGSPVF